MGNCNPNTFRWNISYEECCGELRWPTLQQRRDWLTLYQTYKIVNHLDCLDFDMYYSHFGAFIVFMFNSMYSIIIVFMFNSMYSIIIVFKLCLIMPRCACASEVYCNWFVSVPALTVLTVKFKRL